MVAWKRALEAGQRPENQVEDPEGDGDHTVKKVIVFSHPQPGCHQPNSPGIKDKR